MLTQLKEKYPEDVRVVFRHFPLNSIHNKAALASQAAEAAGKQDKFWEMHDVIFARQQEWAAPEMTVEQFQEWLSPVAEELGLDVAQFETDLTSEEIVGKVQQAYDRGVEIGLPGTPFILINGRIYQGPPDAANLTAIIETMRLADRQFTECPPMRIDPSKQYFATIHTEKGDITLELFADVAPLAVNSFVFLAEEGWFDGVTFHRVLPNFVAQAGDPSGTGFGGPGYAFDNEISPNLKFDKPGMVGMANAGPGSNGSQFFITFAPAPNLDGGYTIFAQVIEGMDVAMTLTPRNPAESMDLPPGDTIINVTIEAK